MSDENSKLFVQFKCASADHTNPITISVRGTDSTVLQNLEWFITEHVHKKSVSFPDVEKDRDTSALYTVLSKFFKEELPRISEIMVRRQLTFGFEINTHER